LKDVDVSVWNEGLAHLLTEEVPQTLWLQINACLLGL
jgi:hypothetical protein